MKNPERDTYLRFQIDSNRINARQNLHNMNLLEKWHNAGVIRLDMSEPSRNEALSGNDKNREEKTEQYGYSQTLIGTPNEVKIIKLIENILFPMGVVNENQKNDVEIIFNAKKYGRILITNDGGSQSQPGGMLGNRDKIKVMLGVEILSDKEAVDRVRKRIFKRDDLAKKIAKEQEIKLPEWVGKD